MDNTMSMRGVLCSNIDNKIKVPLCTSGWFLQIFWRRAGPGCWSDWHSNFIFPERSYCPLLQIFTARCLQFQMVPKPFLFSRKHCHHRCYWFVSSCVVPSFHWSCWLRMFWPIWVICWHCPNQWHLNCWCILRVREDTLYTVWRVRRGGCPSTQSKTHWAGSRSPRRPSAAQSRWLSFALCKISP